MKINELNVLDRSWNLEEDEINEFDNKNAPEAEPIHSKPKIHFV